MNRRILKKLCKRAKAKLINEHGYCDADFTPASGDEAMYAPPGMERRFVSGGRMGSFLEPGPLKGTPLLWLKTSHEYDEWDSYLPTDVLADLEFDWEGAYRDFEASEAASP